MPVGIILITIISQILALGGVYSWSWAPATVLLTLTVALELFYHFARDQALPYQPILLPALGFGGLIATQWFLGATASRYDTLTGFLQMSGGACILYLTLIAFKSPKNIEIYTNTLWIFTGLISAEALAQFFTANGSIYWSRPASYASPVGPFVYHNYYAGMLDLLLPVAIAASFRPPGKPRPDHLALIRRGIVPSLALASLVVSQSRGGLFTLLAEGVIALLVFRPRFRRTQYAPWKVTFAGLLIVAFTFLAGWRPLLDRVMHLEYHDVSAIRRFEIAKICISIWHKHPWVGSGFNTFSVVYPTLQHRDIGIWLQAHNEYLQVLAETGLAGISCVLAFVVLIVYFAWKTLPLPIDAIDVTRRAALIGVIGFLMHSSVDFLFHSPGDMLLFFSQVGLIVTTVRIRRVPREAGRTTSVAVV